MKKQPSTEHAATQRAQRGFFSVSSLCTLCLWGLCACLSFSCSSGGASGSGGGEFPDYNVIRLYNDSPAEIYEVELLAGGTLTSLDHLPADHSPRSDRGVSPDPQTAEVSWRTQDGRRPRAEVPIAPDLPAGFRGVILLRLKPSGDVDVQFVPYRDLR
jgi:hypothetical protein